MLCALLVTLVLPLPTHDIQGEKGNFAIENIHIIDVINGEVIPNATLLIKRGRIDRLANSQIDIPSDFKPISGKGQYVIPGLWDMHTHGLKLSPQLHHPLFIRHGVTSVRDMSGCLTEDDDYWACPDDRHQWTKQALSNEAVSPRYVLQSSYQTNGGNEIPQGFPDFFRLNSSEDAAKVVPFYEHQGADFIKTYTELTPQQFEFLSDAVTSSDLSIAGHKPLQTSLETAIAAGMDSIEHGRLFMFECFEDIEQFRGQENPLGHYNTDKIRDIISKQDDKQCQLLMKQLADSNTYWVPTLTTLQMSARSRDESFRQDQRLKFIPPIVKTLIWEQDVSRAASRGYDEQGEFVHEEYFDIASQQVANAHRSGAKILTGTDNIDTFVFTGSSLHDELEMFVSAGISPIDAMRSATIEAAKFSSLDHELGSIEVGKTADLVFLSANPLEDIRHSQDITAVMFNGHYYNEKALSEMELATIDAANSILVNINYLGDLLLSPLMRAQLVD